MDITTYTTRRSVRTFDGRPLSGEDLAALKDIAATITNPYGIPVSFTFLDTAEYGLSSPVIQGEHLYVAGKVDRVPHAEEAFGISFERLVIEAWRLGIGTTWIGGTFDRAHFEEAAGVVEGQLMCCVSPLGYPAKKMSLREAAMRKGIGADKRLPKKDIFFDGDFATPLDTEGCDVVDALKAVRWAPSAVNRQPWRIVRCGNAFHFYEKRDMAGAGRYPWDVQRIDIGIALCHFLDVAGGTLTVENPGIPCPENVEYCATVTV